MRPRIKHSAVMVTKSEMKQLEDFKSGKIKFEDYGKPYVMVFGRLVQITNKDVERYEKDGFAIIRKP